MRIGPLSLGLGLGLGLGPPLLLGALVGGSALSTPAHAKPSGVVGVACALQGRTFFDKDTTLSDDSGRKLARFSGSESPVLLLEAPKDESSLARIQTGTGQGSFRIAGLIKPSELRVLTRSSLPVVAGHVWIGAGQRVALAGVAGGKLKVDKQVTSPFNQRFSALAECGALAFSSLERPGQPLLTTAPGSSAPSNARVYLMRVPLLNLYASGSSGGSPVTTLQRSPLADSVRFFGTQQRGGFVHIQYHGEVLIDGWARSADLVALPKGEVSDIAPTAYTLSSAPELQLPNTPRVVKVSREVPLRLAAKDNEPAIGIIEPSTEVYVMDVMAGWAAVLPKSLHILPAAELQFWAKAADLGL